MTDTSRKAFRSYLNQEFPEPTHRQGRYRQRSRPYGDYLWHQDREKFEHDYQEWLVENGTTPTGQGATNE